MLARMERPFFKIDVLGSAPFYGNQVTVVLSAEELTGEEMQDLAGWVGSSATHS